MPVKYPIFSPLIVLLSALIDSRFFERLNVDCDMCGSFASVVDMMLSYAVNQITTIAINPNVGITIRSMNSFMVLTPKTSDRHYSLIRHWFA